MGKRGEKKCEPVHGGDFQRLKVEAVWGKRKRPGLGGQVTWKDSLSLKTKGFLRGGMEKKGGRRTFPGKKKGCTRSSKEVTGFKKTESVKVKEN